MLMLPNLESPQRRNFLTGKREKGEREREIGLVRFGSNLEGVEGISYLERER